MGLEIGLLLWLNNITKDLISYHLSVQSSQVRAPLFDSVLGSKRAAALELFTSATTYLIMLHGGAPTLEAGSEISSTVFKFYDSV